MAIRYARSIRLIHCVRIAWVVVLPVRSRVRRVPIATKPVHIAGRTALWGTEPYDVCPRDFDTFRRVPVRVRLHRADSERINNPADDRVLVVTQFAVLVLLLRTLVVPPRPRCCVHVPSKRVNIPLSFRRVHRDMTRVRRGIVLHPVRPALHRRWAIPVAPHRLVVAVAGTGQIARIPLLHVSGKPERRSVVVRPRYRPRPLALVALIDRDRPGGITTNRCPCIFVGRSVVTDKVRGFAPIGWVVGVGSGAIGVPGGDNERNRIGRSTRRISPCSSKNDTRPDPGRPEA